MSDKLVIAAINLKNYVPMEGRELTPVESDKVKSLALLALQVGTLDEAGSTLQATKCRNLPNLQFGRGFNFVGCRKPIITLIDQDPPSGYSKVFLLEADSFTNSGDMENFINKFKEDDDLVIILNRFEYIILRKQEL